MKQIIKIREQKKEIITISFKGEIISTPTKLLVFLTLKLPKLTAIAIKKYFHSIKN